MRFHKENSLAHFFGRLRNHGRISIAVMLLAFILIRIPDIPEWTDFIRHNGATADKLLTIFYELLAGGVSISVFVVLFGLSVRTATEVISRPWRFFLILVIASTVASSCGHEVAVLLNNRAQFWDGDMRSTANLFEIWMRHMIGGALFGWLYFLYRQRSEDANHFASVLTRRSILARQIAQSRLVATRAQIDPELVTKVLRTVLQTQQHKPDQAHTLLNHMIGYLRLAMNRLREPSSSCSAELTLCNSYFALQQAHTGIAISLAANPDARAQGIPVFLIARQLLNAVLQTGATRIEMQIGVVGDKLQIGAATDTDTLSDTMQIALMAQLEEFALHRPIQVQRNVSDDGSLVMLQIPWS